MRHFTNGVPNAEVCAARQAMRSMAESGRFLDQPNEAMEDENRRLKRMYADLSMQADLLKEALGKK